MSVFSYSGKNFTLDGKPFRVISGAMHYWRIVPEYWEDRLKKLKACGFNTVETYVPWNLHEMKEGEFDFSGSLDIVKYIEIATKLGLYIIVRPGPYICSEFDLGGIPSRLLAENIHLRCNDEKYLEKVRPYYRELLTRIAPYQCTRGGNIIMVQIENEYGSYGNDKIYLQKVADMYREYGMECLLYTSDGPCMWMLGGGTLPDYPCVANFGSDPVGAFAVLDEFRPNQPSMCGEFWCGWFDHWGEEHHTRTAEETTRDLVPMLEAGASFNFYMFHGGTNFGFTNGANHTGDCYQPTITSYDYCSPLSESGDLTPTYYAVRDAIAKYTDFKGVDYEVENLPKAAYGKLTLTERAPLFENLDNISSPVYSAAPLSMEEMGQSFGYIMYSTTMYGPCEQLPLIFEHVHDRALVYIDGKFVGIRERSGRMDEINIALKAGESIKVDILVENCGRVNYGPKLMDKKGIFGGIRLGQRYHFGWTIRTLPMDNLTSLSYSEKTENDGMPSFLCGKLNIAGKPADTFIRTDGFHKGFITVNGFNIGRYVNDRGPQKTLYIPAPLLHEGENEIVIFESDSYDKPVVEFFDKPDLG